MSRFLCSVLVAVAIIAVVAAPASATPDEDFVVGTGEIMVFPPGLPPFVLTVSVEAHSDASGGDPSGTFTVSPPPGQGPPLFTGPVTCLGVTGNAAVIGFEDAGEGHLIAEVVDNSATGSRDTIGLVPGVGCSIGSSIPAFPVASGDFVVHDAPPLTTKDQCKDGGWRDFTDDEGHPFRHQGACVAFVQHAS